MHCTHAVFCLQIILLCCWSIFVIIVSWHVKFSQSVYIKYNCMLLEYIFFSLRIYVHCNDIHLQHIKWEKCTPVQSHIVLLNIYGNSSKLRNPFYEICCIYLSHCKILNNTYKWKRYHVIFERKYHHFYKKKLNMPGASYICYGISTYRKEIAF